MRSSCGVRSSIVEASRLRALSPVALSSPRARSRPEVRAEALERLERRAQLRARLESCAGRGAGARRRRAGCGPARRAASRARAARGPPGTAASASSPSARIARQRASIPCTERARLIGAHAAKRSRAAMARSGSPARTAASIRSGAAVITMGGTGVTTICSKWAIASRGSPRPSSSSARASRAFVVAQPMPLRTLRRSASLRVLAARVGVAVQRRDPRLHPEQSRLVVLVAERARELEPFGHAGLRLADAALGELGEGDAAAARPARPATVPSARSLRDDARAVLARARPVAGERPHEDRHGHRPQAVEARPGLERRGESCAGRRGVAGEVGGQPVDQRRRRSARAARLSRSRSRMLRPAVNRRSSQPPCRPVNSDHSASSVASSGAASRDGTGGVAQHARSPRRASPGARPPWRG